ncbi:MAG: class I SAM-dependent methyltransferase [Acidobacteria bacterium]|nr:class I SAM-dependent methyltransferase [Acidobacteriota bacterium]
MLQELIRREFNRWAEQGRGRGMEKSHWEITRQLIELMNAGADNNVVDLGCGVGGATRVLAQKASRGLVVAIDLSDRMIAEARSGYRNPPNILFVVADAARIPCASEFFNALLSVESIYYYPDLEGAFSEVFRILKPQAKTFFLINYYKENEYGHDWAKYIDIPVHLLGAEDYLQLLTKAGFRSATHRRIIDSTPIPEDWTPTQWFRTREQQMKFKAEGALLLMAEK